MAASTFRESGKSGAQERNQARFPESRVMLRVGRLRAMVKYCRRIAPPWHHATAPRPADDDGPGGGEAEA